MDQRPPAAPRTTAKSKNAYMICTSELLVAFTSGGEHNVDFTREYRWYWLILPSCSRDAIKLLLFKHLQSLSTTSYLLKQGFLCLSVTLCFKFCFAVEHNFIWQSGLTIVSQGCTISSNNSFKRLDAIFCIEIIIKSLSWWEALQWKCSRGSRRDISMHEKKTHFSRDRRVGEDLVF